MRCECEQEVKGVGRMEMSRLLVSLQATRREVSGDVDAAAGRAPALKVQYITHVLHDCSEDLDGIYRSH